MVKLYKASIQQTLDILFLRGGVEFITSSDCVSRDSADRTLIAWDFQTTAKLSNQIYHVRISFSIPLKCLYKVIEVLLHYIPEKAGFERGWVMSLVKPAHFDSYTAQSQLCALWCVTRGPPVKTRFRLLLWVLALKKITWVWNALHIFHSLKKWNNTPFGKSN